MFFKKRFATFALMLAVSAGTLISQDEKKVFDPELNLYIRQENTANERELRYKPDEQDFVIINGKNKFNRALYGTHTGFRVETGDVPEFALYMPRMGGNLSFRLNLKNKSIALNNSAHIECRYRPGSRIYHITDPLLGKGSLRITALAMADAEGLILKIETGKIPSGLNLSWIFGGCADKRFSREGDLGVDAPDCFDLKPEYCIGNEFSTNKNKFQVIFGAKKDKKLSGIFPEKSTLTVTQDIPVLNGKLNIKPQNIYYVAIYVPDDNTIRTDNNLNNCFAQAEEARQKLTSQLIIDTPDPYFNTLGGALAVAADGIWSGETWLHGAVGWRMPLSGWRAAYTGDALGWHDRARKHFDAYAASQVTHVTPVRPHPTQDPAANLARAEKSWGTPMYSNGYICRNPNRNDQMHHYDMNLCYIDELLWHLNWTGDTDYARKIWPVIVRHLDWEKRNFDPDNDGLYDAYCCIWASDALYYNSGAVTHSSAYNYRANKLAALIAEKIGENPAPFTSEAEKILNALNSRLWLPSKGHWAEFQDFGGDKKLHESAAIWTIYHAIDSDVPNAFQGYEATRYVDTEIPHIPVKARGLKDDNYATISTSNWMPYSWSINNVAFAEVMHMALAYWQAGRAESAFKLLKSSVLDGMYLGASPGNVGQISYYDAARGECYRDFGDPIGVMSRALVQGLFGIIPDALNGKLTLRPGFPANWDHASIGTPDIQFSFKRNSKTEKYTITQNFSRLLTIKLEIPALYDKISSIKVNNKLADWKINEGAVGKPIIIIDLSAEKENAVVIEYAGNKPNIEPQEIAVLKNETVNYTPNATLLQVYDPQGILNNLKQNGNQISGIATGAAGHRSMFCKLRQGDLIWWQALNIEIKLPEKTAAQAFSAVNSNLLDMIDLSPFFNDSVTNIFKNKYLTPRSPYTTLQIPVQGIGEWCHPLTTAEIDDSGIRKIASEHQGVLAAHTGLSFRTPATGRNVVFTSRWDNFPQRVEVPVSGAARNAYLMLAGSTNHMQSRFVNGWIIAQYTDGSSDTLQLVNPDNWCPIEQDYYTDGKAFTLSTLRPYRVHLKTGLVSNNLEKDLKIAGVYGRKIEGGAGVLLDMPLNINKKLHKIILETRANEVIIGLMSLTLQR